MYEGPLLIAKSILEVWTGFEMGLLRKEKCSQCLGLVKNRAGSSLSGRVWVWSGWRMDENRRPHTIPDILRTLGAKKPWDLALWE